MWDPALGVVATASISAPKDRFDAEFSAFKFLVMKTVDEISRLLALNKGVFISEQASHRALWFEVSDEELAMCMAPQGVTLQTA